MVGWERGERPDEYRRRTSYSSCEHWFLLVDSGIWVIGSHFCRVGLRPEPRLDSSERHFWALGMGGALIFRLPELRLMKQCFKVAMSYSENIHCRLRTNNMSSSKRMTHLSFIWENKEYEILLLDYPKFFSKVSSNNIYHHSSSMDSAHALYLKSQVLH